MCTHLRFFDRPFAKMDGKKILGNKSQTQTNYGGNLMANRKRNIQVKFNVTAEERQLIRRKMETAHTNQLGAYLRKMAIDGLIIYTDMTDFKEYSKELSAIGRNINQLAKRLNSTKTIYDNDVTEIKERLDEIWQLQRRILLSLH